MSRTLHVTPGKVSRSAAGITALIAVLFLIFGTVFFWLVIGDTPSSEIALRVLQSAFWILWTVVCLAVAVINFRVYRKSGTVESNAVLDVEDRGEEDFDVKLRKLETLFKDGLLSEEEYNTKRTKILEKEW